HLYSLPTSLHDALPISRGASMICSRSELLEIIKRTIEQATPEEKRQLREALCGSRCELCGRRRLTLLLDTTSGRFQCFQCVGSRSEEHTSELQSPDHLV